jgi:hypothetical protein
MTERSSQTDLIKEFFIKNSNRDIEHPEVVDWVVAEWEKLTGKKLRDPDRAIRLLYQKGFLIKVAKGKYRYEPDFAKNKKQEDFTEF